MYCINRKS
jgi:hypothetical protein